MRTQHSYHFDTSRRIVLELLAGALLAVPGALWAQSWTPLANTPQAGGNPVSIQMLLLLPDGTVMAQQAPTGTTNSTAWFRLTPDAQGSYVNGNWSARGSMNEARLFYSSVVLNTGKVFVAGGEYSSNGTQSINAPNDEYSATAELYDPATDRWTFVPAVPAAWFFPSTMGPLPFSFGDSQATLLPNGNVLLGPVFGNGGYRSTIYDVGNNAWIDGPNQFTSPNDSGNPNEASWLKLRDGSILTISNSAQVSQRFIPANGTTPNQWVADGSLPFSLYGSIGNEIGPAFLLPNGNGFFIGANGKTAIYTPTGNATAGSWASGPLIPNVAQNVLDNNGNITGTTIVTGAAPDVVGCMLVDGKVLCAFTGQLYNDPRAGTNISTYWKNKKNPIYPAPVSFYIYDPTTQTFGPQINGPTGQTDNIPGYQATMLALPDGKVLYSNYGSQLYVFDPGTPPIAAGKPVITSIASNLNGGYHLTGKGLNGISTGAAYGDDAQMDTNFPLVRITDDTNNVYYAPTFFWSSTGVQTGTQTVSTEFVLPPALASGGGGNFSLVVVANGIASDPVPFTGEIWVDFNAPGIFANGSFDLPYKTFAQGTTAVGSGGVLWIKAGHRNEIVTNLNKPMTIQAYGGPATIGP
jgi:hypothetical protein